MKQSKPNHIISVDSETGIYWNGERVLRHNALIKAAIDQATDREYKTHRQSALNFSAMQITADAVCQ